jgi:hypothetical protein
MSAATTAAIGVVFFDGTAQLVVFVVAAVAFVGEPLVLKQATNQK